MSKNIKLNDTNYNGVSTVQLPTTDGGTATFKDTDEITTPSGSKTITENGTHDVSAYAQAIVNVATSGESGDSGNDAEFLEALIGWEQVVITEDVHFTVPDGITVIRSYAFASMTKDSSSGAMRIDLPDTIERFCDHVFSFNTRAIIGSLPPSLKVIESYAFQYATKIFDSNTELEIPASVEEIGELAFYQYNGGVNTLTFKGTPTSIGYNALQGNVIKTINVPWAEGEVANAPWGATSATINYNYTGE